LQSAPADLFESRSAQLRFPLFNRAIDRRNCCPGVWPSESDTVVVDLKAIKNPEHFHFAVVRSQLKTMGIQQGLLLNFAKTTLEPTRVIAF
jgi:hypothetical protein